ncbi:MAG: hypothetical protein M3Q09_08120, partial [Gemmatimonadota bacterium]|nr:hypothetical protein [Gemmatimonadota bacterium]
YDDAKAREFAPFTLTRPVSELRAGAEIIRARWETVAGMRATAFIGAAHLANFDEAGAPASVNAGEDLAAGSLVANSRFVVALDESIGDGAAAFSCEGRVCAVRLSRSTSLHELARGTIDLEAMAEGVRAAEIRGRWLPEVWNLIGDLSAQLMDDIAVLGPRMACGSPGNAIVMGNHEVYCESGAHVEPFVVFDASAGPVLIRRGTVISAFTRIVGPTYIGEGSTVIGDAIRACSIGDVCKVRGEISGIVMLGHSNKGHTGFVGSSYLGRWVNLGSGTTTSNLKNTYGSVQLWTPTGLRDTGLQFVGSLLGDHAKTGIGTMLTTGCVVGAGANVFGSGVTPKRIPPFAWGDREPYGRFDVEKFAEVAARMMARRHVVLGEKGRRQLVDSHAASEPSG